MQGLPEHDGSESVIVPADAGRGATNNRRRYIWFALAAAVLACVALAFGVLTGLRAPSAPNVAARCGTATQCARLGRSVSFPLPPALPGREAVPLETLAQTPPDIARALNAKAMLFKGPITPARPFTFVGSPDDRTRAIECLAAAQLYEAGFDESDQKAVAQVVLNRVRHPAYPHTICGVVFEGSQRTTGCQFTFTCDGSMTRRYPDDAWVRARSLAARMIDGEVDKRVGWATHYHTDWVYPYWSPSLDKLTAVKTHLFFKWRGTWGTGPAFAAPYRGQEPLVARLHGKPGDIPMLAYADPETALDPKIARILPPLADIPVPRGVAQDALGGNALKLVHPDGGGFGLLLKANANADEVMTAALRLCFGQDICRVLGWSSAADIPRGFPIPASALAKLSFSYVRTPETPVPQFRFDCGRFTKVKQTQCLNP